MIERLPFKRLILRAALRHVSPVVIRGISVSDHMMPDFNDIFCAVLGWSGEMGYTSEKRTYKKQIIGTVGQFRSRREAEKAVVTLRSSITEHRII
jgi:hypothetical protein